MASRSSGAVGEFSLATSLEDRVGPVRYPCRRRCLLQRPVPARSGPARVARREWGNRFPADYRGRYVAFGFFISPDVSKIDLSLRISTWGQYLLLYLRA